MSFSPKKFLKYIFIALLAAVLIKSFIFDAYMIPTGSMENTLLEGDYILINKVAYSLSTPHTIPLLNTWISSAQLINFKEPKQGDVVIFKFPGYPTEVYPEENSSFIKRIIGLPGDTVQIIKGEVFVNHIKIELPKDAIIPFDKTKNPDPRIYPKNRNWENNNYGPVVVPKEGDTIQLNTKNIEDWQALIDRELGGKVVSVEGSVINIQKRPEREYTVKKNYYFMLGDNREDSMDSRYWGFVPKDYIIGKAVLVYWSWDSYKSANGITEFFKPLRLKRLFKIIN
ncbi:MAG TPA: signal peptidase I [Ignavibacteriaceae bacterium]|nr:signal peptidase I [Ignavibacteriaceae bacterium]